MNTGKRVGMLVGVIVLLLGLGVAGVYTIRGARQRAAAERYRRQMSDPAYLRQQTARLQPAVAGQLHARFPQAQLAPSPADAQGYVVYTVTLPATASRELPRLQAYLARLYGTYARQGYHARFLIQHNGKVIGSVP